MKERGESHEILMRTTKQLRLISLAGLLFLPLASFAESAPAASTATTPAIRKTESETGVASFYADKYHGRPTASGEIFDTYKLTAAHCTLPFGTMVRVTHTGNNCSVIVRINDRGPFVKGRLIDLSRAAARQLGMERAGLANVKVEVLPAVTVAAAP